MFAAYDPSTASLGVTVYLTTILERTGAPDIFSLLRLYRLRWSDYVCRMEDGQLPKDIFYGQLLSAPHLSVAASSATRTY